MQVVKVNRLCTNCLGGGHFKNQCKSLHKCKMCQKSHHTLLHSASPRSQDRATAQRNTPVGSHAATRLKSDVLLMTCRVLITAPDSSTVETRALLDNASSASFIGTQSLSTSHKSINPCVWDRWNISQTPHTVCHSLPTLISPALWKKDRCHCSCGTDLRSWIWSTRSN